MVAHNGSAYLPRTLSALADQTRSVDRAIGVDTGSRDHSLALLERAFGAHSVLSHERGKGGMGAAVSAGLAGLAPRVAGGADAMPEWIWLLHDDAAPAPEALAELLAAVERAPSVTVAGCKQLDWHEERKLIDVGLSTSRWAERLTLIDADELDQGQYDGRSDTFAVTSGSSWAASIPHFRAAETTSTSAGATASRATGLWLSLPPACSTWPTGPMHWAIPQPPEKRRFT